MRYLMHSEVGIFFKHDGYYNQKVNTIECLELYGLITIGVPMLLNARMNDGSLHKTYPLQYDCCDPELELLLRHRRFPHGKQTLCYFRRNKEHHSFLC
jgi:hypothetical protein